MDRDSLINLITARTPLLPPDAGYLADAILAAQGQEGEDWKPAAIEAMGEREDALSRMRVAEGRERDIAAVLDGRAPLHALQARVRLLTDRLTEVRKRVISDHWTGTSPDSDHWWSCRLCTWLWRDGESEKHEPGCPAALEAGGPGEGG